MTTTTIDLFKYQPEDGGILDCWLDLKGDDWLYVAGFGTWFYWADTHWQKDECQLLRKQIQNLLDQLNKIAIADRAKITTTDDVAIALRRRLDSYISSTKRTQSRVASIEAMAQAHRAIAADQLNTFPVLNLRNGTLDLNTIELKPHNRNDYLTYTLDYEYDPSALAPRFERFVSEVFVKEGTVDADLELCQLFQEALGYSLTPDTKHEAMFWLVGDGGNGKTVAITVIQWLLSEMACSVDFSTIGQQGNYDLADVQGKRVIFSTESERGQKASEGYIKRIVSGERINARAIYGVPFEFKSTAKVWWGMNDKPLIRDTSNAIWRRLKLIPFNRTFTEQDKDPELLQKLEAEKSGILNFALDGLRRLRDRGRFPEAAAAVKALNEYRHESNPVAQWRSERTCDTTTADTPAKALYEDYKLWSDSTGRQALNIMNFGRELKRLRIEFRENARHSKNNDPKVCNRYALNIVL